MDMNTHIVSTSTLMYIYKIYIMIYNPNTKQHIF